MSQVYSKKSNIKKLEESFSGHSDSHDDTELQYLIPFNSEHQKSPTLKESSKTQLKPNSRKQKYKRRKKTRQRSLKISPSKKINSKLLKKIKNSKELAPESTKVSNLSKISLRTTTKKKILSPQKAQKVILIFTQKIAKRKSKTMKKWRKMKKELMKSSKNLTKFMTKTFNSTNKENPPTESSNTFWR